MSDHTEHLRIEAEGMRLHGYADTADAIEALLDERDALANTATEMTMKYATLGVMFDKLAAERDALAARLDRIEHAARLVADHHDLALAEDSYRGVNPSVVAALDSLSSAIGDDT